MQHQKGHLSEETIRFLVGSVSVMLKSKFLQDENGLWYNERLEKEISARVNFVNSRRTNGLKGGRPKNEKTDRLTYNKATVDVNVNADVNENVLKKDKRKTDFLADENWKAQFCMAKNLQPDELKTIMAEFISDCDLKGEHVDSYKRYFTNWYNKKIINGSAKTIPITAGGTEKLGTSAARIRGLKNW